MVRLHIDVEEVLELLRAGHKETLLLHPLSTKERPTLGMTPPTKKGNPQLAYELYSPFSNTVIFAVSSSLRNLLFTSSFLHNLAAAVPPPATPPTITMFLPFANELRSHASLLSYEKKRAVRKQRSMKKLYSQKENGRKGKVNGDRL